MKTGILIAVVALGSTLLLAPAAHSWWSFGPDINQRFSGSSFTIDTDDDTGAARSLQDLIAKSKRGTAHLDVMTVISEAGPGGDRCPGQFVVDVISQIWVETYRDGSTLSASVDPGAFACSDGVVFTAEVTGTVAGGTGRFADASGTWAATASVVDSIMTGTLTVEFD